MCWVEVKNKKKNEKKSIEYKAVKDSDLCSEDGNTLFFVIPLLWKITVANFFQMCYLLD